MVPENPDVPSSPDSIRANPPAPPGVSDTVHIGTSASKSSATHAIKLKQQKLSFWTSSTTVPVSEAVVNETTAHPALNINAQELIDAIYAEALEKYKSKWVERFPWLVLTKTVRGLPAFKCSLYTKHAGVRERCGRTGKGATDVQTQSFRKHAGTRKHKLALEKQEALLSAASKQPRIDEHRAAVDAEKIRVTSLLVALLFVSDCDAPMGTWVKLVQYLARKGVQGFPKKGYGTYYTTYGYGELTQSLATWLQTTQLEHILRSPFIGIAIDERTDRVRGKHLILYATFVRESVVVTEFMQLITVEKADASTLLSLLLSHLQAVGVDLQRISGISIDGASVMMGSQAGLVVRLREKLPHLVSCHCIAHREALAAKDAAEALPVFNMVDDLIRMVSDLLGRSDPKHQRFMDLQELFTETSLEVQGIHQVRWLSRGDALLRILAVWPAVIVFLKEFHAAMFLLATSYRFHFLMYFLADVLEQLNFLNKTFQQRQLDLVSLHTQIKRTTSHIESRYVDCGEDFGGGLSRWLSPFIERYGPGKERELTVEGPDSDGRPSTFVFELHEEKVKGYEGPCDHDACVEVCTDFTERIVGNLERRLSDLDSPSGVRLFLPDEWPKSKSERHARCVEWLNSLVTLFKAHAAEDILPGGSSGGGGGGRGGGSGGQGQQQPQQQQQQQHQHQRQTPTSKQILDWYAEHGSSGGPGRCPYIIRTGRQCTGFHTEQRCFARLSDAWRTKFPDVTEFPNWADLLRRDVPIFDLDYEAILAAMYILSVSAEGDCYLCVPPDPGITPGMAPAALGACESAPLGTAPAQALHTFTLDSGASRCFFRDSTTVTPLPAHVPVSLADPSGGLVLARSSTMLPCPAVPSGELSGLHLPSFYTNLGPVCTPSPLRRAPPLCLPSCTRLLRSLPALPPLPAPPCIPCVEGRQRAAPHSSLFPPIEAPLQTLHLDVWGPARRKGDVPALLIPWICTARLQLRERFQSDFPVLRLHSDRGGEFSSDLLAAFCAEHGIRQTFTLPASPQQNGVAERRIGLVMEVARTSMIHVAAPHFLWPFAVRYAAHQLNLWPRVSLPETSPTLLWTGKVGDASRFWVWGARAFVRDTIADKLSPRAIPCVFLGFVPDAPGWQFYDPASRRVLASQDVTFDESVPFYHLFPYRTAPRPLPPLFLIPGPPQVDPLPAPAPAPSGVSQVDPPVPVPVEVTDDYGPAGSGAVPGGAELGDAESGGAERVEPGGAEPAREEPGGAASGGAASEGAAFGGAESGGESPAGSETTFTRSPWSSRLRPRVPLTSQQLQDWYGRRQRRASAPQGSTAGGSSAGVAGPGGACTEGTGASGAGGVVTEGTGATEGAGAAGGIGATGGADGAGAAEGTGAAGGAGPAEGPGATGGAGAAEGTGAAGGAGAAGAVQTEGLAERREPASRPISPVRSGRSGRCVPRQRQTAVSGPPLVVRRPSSPPPRVPLPSPPASSLPVVADPVSDQFCAEHSTVTRLLATVVTDPSFESAAASALVAELVDFAAACRLDYAASIVAEFESVCPPFVGGDCALGTDVLEDTQEDLECLAAAAPHLVAMLLAPEGDPNAPDIPTPCLTLRQSGRDYELHSLDFSTTFLHGSLHEEIWLRRPPGFTGSFPPGTQWSLRRPVYGLRQAPREWHDTMRMTLAALGFAPSTADPSLFLRTDTSLPPFYILVNVDDFVFATVDTEALALVLQCFGFIWSSAQTTPLATGHSLSAPPSDESVEPNGPYPELVGCLMYLMTCTRPDLAYPLGLLARYVAPGRHRKVHMDAAKRVLRYLCSTSGMGLMLGGRGDVVLTSHSDASWAAIALCQEHRLEHRTKHIALRYFLARELQQRGQLRLAYVANRANTADIFTKALPPGDHQRLCTLLGLVPTLPHLL
ncbi:unnamed protein product [Closterium sp. NIES-53]